MNGRPVLKLRNRPVPAPTTAPEPAPAPMEAPPVPLAQWQEVPVDVFAFVWKEGGPSPRRRHKSIEGAQREAARLRKLAPDMTFHVYEARLVAPISTSGETNSTERGSSSVAIKMTMKTEDSRHGPEHQPAH
jgi:hypothetical protein